LTRVAEIIQLLGGRVHDSGHAPRAEQELEGPAPFDQAGPPHLAFATARFSDPDKLRNSGAGLLIVDEPALESLGTGEIQSVVISSRNARLDFIRVLQRFFPPTRPSSGIHPSAVVDEGADVSPTASIGPLCTIQAGVSIAEDTVLEAGVHIYSRTRIGRRVVIRSGAVIGADGFGYERDASGALQPFPQLGGVVIEDEVEIGSNTSIDRGALADTIVGTRARVDNLVHVAHNVRIGADAAVIAHAMLGGGAIIGAGAWIAPCACIREGVTVGAGAVVGLGAVVTADVGEHQTVLGNPAREIGIHRSIQSEMKRLAHDRLTAGGDGA
jgi:UDP-3-O-[3-hydroxymyristoyl] glucosamine N-acyltransferase